MECRHFYEILGNNIEFYFFQCINCGKSPTLNINYLNAILEEADTL